MKKYIIFSLFLVSFFEVSAQQNNNEGIVLSSFIPNQTERIPTSAKRILANKLTKIITKNGISNSGYNARFVMVPLINVSNKDIIGSAPVKIALNLDLTLYIGDGKDGTLFASESFQLKGVGSNETKAYISAIKRLKAKNPAVQEFISNGKAKIIDYYNANCSKIISKAGSLEAQGKLKEALALYTSVPVASTCFSKIENKIKKAYQKIIDKDCKEKLARAKSIWIANQDIDAANDAAAILSEVEPKASSYNQVKTLYAKIAKRVKDLKDRDWNYKLKVLDLKKTYIKAARDVGVAYGKNQPKNVSYNVRGWR
ncbi:hypothetical protein [Tenacibaculum haliotis]|uniref:hypothetical protein n=1 Tax=Tenacibaculum haliotis TaxID=1888914 RepID=UPI0021B0118A|nr:hypothetical protein [Tenacibaculum haliotis]MCT4699929.1 hypothetical protein [Tenacibaculum haliotis]